jgi:hypothetical protein
MHKKSNTLTQWIVFTKGNSQHKMINRQWSRNRHHCVHANGHYTLDPTHNSVSTPSHSTRTMNNEQFYTARCCPESQQRAWTRKSVWCKVKGTGGKHNTYKDAAHCRCSTSCSSTDWDVFAQPLQTAGALLLAGVSNRCLWMHCLQCGHLRQAPHVKKVCICVIDRWQVNKDYA